MSDAGRRDERARPNLDPGRLDRYARPLQELADLGILGRVGLELIPRGIFPRDVLPLDIDLGNIPGRNRGDEITVRHFRRLGLLFVQQVHQEQEHKG